MTAPALMFQGTGSDVGKSLLVAGLCRAFANRGLSVRPFKPQNMSNNAAVTADGGEVGRAQALQARACRTPLLADMNPVLLKPQTEIGAQLIVRGEVRGAAAARAFQNMKPDLMEVVLESFARTRAQSDLVLIEGAGSAAEVNLRDADIANMGFAEAADIPVVLIGDIDRGGVIAQLVGTVELLSPSEKGRLGGYIVNKFRGDASLFESGLDIITERTGLPALGIVPHFPDAARLPREDAFAVGDPRARAAPEGRIKVAVPVLSRIANFDDLDPLRAEPGVLVDMIPPGIALPGDADLIILPGSKATIADLAFLREQGWDIDIRAHVRRGGMVLGLCAGFQMLGQAVADPEGVEGPPGGADGLGLIDVETVLAGEKTLAEAAGMHVATGESVIGYEMHMGRTTGKDCGNPMLRLAAGPDGAVSADGRVMGCYLHGLFAADDFRRALLGMIGDRAFAGVSYDAEIDKTLDALADHLGASLNLDRLYAVAATCSSAPATTRAAKISQARR